jgi:hypothetical protein
LIRTSEAFVSVEVERDFRVDFVQVRLVHENFNVFEAQLGIFEELHGASFDCEISLLQMSICVFQCPQISQLLVCVNEQGEFVFEQNLSAYQAQIAQEAQRIQVTIAYNHQMLIYDL